jgi:hypothetical protein
MCSGPQKAVDYVVTVDVGSRDRACLVDACWERTLESACARAGSVERRDDAVGSTYEAVKHIARVNVRSVNRSRVVDVRRDGTLESACARARNVATSTRTALAQTLAKAAQQVSESEALPVKNTAQLRDVCLAAARPRPAWGHRFKRMKTCSSAAGVPISTTTK